MFSIDLFRQDPAILVLAGETVIAEGETGDAMYVVIEGKLDIRVHGTPVETVETGGVVGEMSLIDHRARSASVVAITDAKLVAIDEKRFMFLVQNTPYFAIKMMQLVVDRLRRADAHVPAAAEVAAANR